VVSRCVKVGLDVPSEPTVGHIINVLVSLSGSTFTPAELHGLVCDFKKKLKHGWKTSKSCSPADVVQYPPDPKQLPEAVHKQAYINCTPVDDSPLIVSTCHVPLRRTSTALRFSHTMSLPTTNAPQMDFSGMQNMVGQMMMNFLVNNQNRNNPGLLPGLQLARPRSRTPLALPSSEVVENQVDAIALLQPEATPSVIAASPTLSLHAAGNAASAIAPPLPEAQHQAPMFELPSAADHLKIVQAALDSRKEAANMAKTDLPDKSSDGKPTGKAKAKAKAKPKAKAKAQAKANGKTKNAKLTIAKPAASAAPSLPPKKSTPCSSAARPAEAQAGCTVFWGGGKIQRSDRMSAWRVFIHSGDRCDKASLSTHVYHAFDKLTETTCCVLCAVVYSLSSMFLFGSSLSTERSTIYLRASGRSLVQKSRCRMAAGA
jgi:hypothetical protein